MIVDVSLYMSKSHLAGCRELKARISDGLSSRAIATSNSAVQRIPEGTTERLSDCLCWRQGRRQAYLATKCSQV